jgi:hypothetical protein
MSWDCIIADPARMTAPSLVARSRNAPVGGDFSQRSTLAEIAWLRVHYPKTSVTAILAATQRKTWDTVQRMAIYHGIGERISTEYQQIAAKAKRAATAKSNGKGPNLAQIAFLRACHLHGFWPKFDYHNQSEPSYFDARDKIMNRMAQLEDRGREWTWMQVKSYRNQNRKQWEKERE